MQENQLYLSPLETQLNCTAGDVFRNSFIKKEHEAEDEEQSYYDHGHDNDHVDRTRKKMTSWVIGI